MGDKDPSHEQPKLPQARMYLKSAQWGFDELLAKKLSDYPFRFWAPRTMFEGTSSG
jgi:hypothetical protein